jgi:hypothetical protein
LLPFRQSPLSVRAPTESGLLGTGTPKKQSSPVQISSQLLVPRRRVVTCVGLRRRLDQFIGLASQARGGLIVGSKKRVKRKSFAGKRFGILDRPQIEKIEARTMPSDRSKRTQCSGQSHHETRNLISDSPLAASPFLGRRVLISCSCPKFSFCPAIRAADYVARSEFRLP